MTNVNERSVSKGIDLFKGFSANRLITGIPEDLALAAAKVALVAEQSRQAPLSEVPDLIPEARDAAEMVLRLTRE